MAILITSGCDRKVETPPASEVPGRTGPRDVEPDHLRAATGALQRNDLDGADAAIRNHLLKDPDNAQALELAGDVATRRGDRDRAATMYRAAVDQRSAPSESLMDKLATSLMAAGRAYDSLDVLQQTIARYPESVDARSGLIGLAAVLGLPEMAVESLRWLSQRGQGDAETLQVLADPRRVEADDELCRTLRKRNPSDLRPEYGLARLDAQQLQWKKVTARLEPLLEKHKSFLPAYTLYGRALIELAEFERIPEWRRRAPDHYESSPQFWLVAGLWAQHLGNHGEAARAFWESIRRDQSGAPEAWTHLALSLKQLERDDEAERVAEHVTRHIALRDALKIHFERSAGSQQAALGVAAAMMQLGRIWEAEGWARLAVSLPEDRVDDIRERYLAIRSQLSVDSPWQAPAKDLARQIDLSDLAEIVWGQSATAKIAPSPLVSGDIMLEDQAPERGWIHTCQIAPEAAQQGHWIYQSVGGGVGVIDFDLDGWPDLAVTMLDGQPLMSDSAPNRLFRNLDGQFVACTAASGYADTGFAQGVTIGDYNEDGFPDIFDANIGRNRMFRNNGDGTFRDVTDEIGIDGNVWTTSAVIADIDGDGISDLYETAYCSGTKPYQRRCGTGRNAIGTCPPLQFDAEQDRVWRGAGDGTFTNAASRWMNQTSPGRGLGVVAGLFDERPGLDLYIANDMTVNHFWSGNGSQDAFQLTDLGAVRGLGYSGRSLSQASMGMAAADPDSDGDIDFFLTHFSDDHNTYYEQVGPGIWIDRSSQVGLAAPSMPLLGFGTEWVDLDNNGRLELIVTNGHVDDVESSKISYRMPPQVFRLDASGRWTELDRKKLGEYFAGDHLGRALATVDVDRDGRIDVAVTHLYDPVSLLINETTGGGNWISLELKSSSGARDAIGARVTATLGDREVTSQLTAGDGYMCSNQRRVHLGTGNANQVDNLVVSWPSGRREDLGALVAGHGYLVVEGSGEAFELEGAR